jgi:hypothetical protein
MKREIFELIIHSFSVLRLNIGVSSLQRVVSLAGNHLSVSRALTMFQPNFI